MATIRANHLTIRGVGNGRAKLPAHGRDAGGKGIWVVTGSDLTVENIEFSGARVRDRNGAGIRPEGKNLTVRNCRFYDCENGILGGNGEMLFEGCEFEHCGPVANPATHSLYIGERCTKLVFRYNYSTDVIEGHLLKSRAKESWLLYNRITDENGTGSAVADFPNGGVVVVIGNVMHKGARGNNSRVIAYGMEGIKHERNALCVVNNTMVYEHRHTNAFFVRVEKSPEGLVPVIRNNLCIGKVPLTNWPKVDAAGNLLLKTVAEARLGKPGEVRLPPHGRLAVHRQRRGGRKVRRLRPDAHRAIRPPLQERAPPGGRPARCRRVPVAKNGIAGACGVRWFGSSDVKDGSRGCPGKPRSRLGISMPEQRKLVLAYSCSSHDTSNAGPAEKRKVLPSSSSRTAFPSRSSFKFGPASGGSPSPTSSKWTSASRDFPS